jgi:hypothetical protein
MSLQVVILLIIIVGGHQENLGVNAVNVNHGPGSSVWISIDK